MKITFEGASPGPMAGAGFPVISNTAAASTERTQEKSGIITDISGVVKDNEILSRHGRTGREVMEEAGQKDIGLTRDYLTVMSNILSEKDMGRMMEEGYSPASMPVGETVTIMDKIKASLMQAGVEITGYTDTLDDETLNAITGNEGLSAQLKDSFSKNEIPLTEKTAREAMDVLTKAAGLTELSDESKKYMVENRMEPTVDDIYTASHSGVRDTLRQGRGYYQEPAGYLSKKAEDINWDSLKGAMDTVIAQAGYEGDPLAEDAAKWLVEKGVPLTPENLTTYMQVNAMSLPPTPGDVFDAVAAAAVDGREPGKANIFDKRSSWEKANELLNKTLSLTEEDVARGALDAEAQGVKLTLGHMIRAHERYENTAGSYISRGSRDGKQETGFTAQSRPEISSNTLEQARGKAETAKAGRGINQRASEALQNYNETVGKPLKAAGINQETSGINLKAGGINHKAVGNNQETIGKSIEASGEDMQNSGASADHQNGESLSIKARLKLEEIRLAMTLEANRELIKSGFSIDTAPIEEAIRALKQAEDELNQRLFGKAWENYKNSLSYNEASYNTYNEDIAGNEASRLGEIPAVNIGAGAGQESLGVNTGDIAGRESRLANNADIAGQESTAVNTNETTGQESQAAYADDYRARENRGTVPHPADIYRETLALTSALPNMPAATAGRVDITEDTLPIVGERARNLENAYRMAGEQYESLGTQVRRDLGDSIRQAFRNVDDILADMGLPVDEVNRRALRILGYNQMELSEENIRRIKAADQAIRTIMDKMDPASVLRLIREGFNPLSMTVAELNEQLGQDPGREDARKRFAKFLYKLEQRNEITPEEKESYIGIYRLIRQIEKTDGAVIGSLVNQGAELNFKNLLSALRSKKSRGMDFTVDDSTPMRKNYTSPQNAIDRQIETAYSAALERELAEQVARADVTAMSQIINEPETGIEQFLWQQAEVMEESAKASENYIRHETQKVRSLDDVEDDDIRLLELMDEPATTDNLLAMGALRREGGADYKRLRELAGTYESYEEFRQEAGRIEEAFESAQDAKEALKQLTEQAMNLTESTIYDGAGITGQRVEELGLIYKQLSFVARLTEREQYDIPVITEDDIFTLHLKVMSTGDEDKKGRIEASMEAGELGMTGFRLRLKDGKLSGIFTADNKDGGEQIAALGRAMTEALEAMGYENPDIYTGVKTGKGPVVDLKKDYYNTGDGEGSLAQAGALSKALLPEDAGGVSMGNPEGAGDNDPSARELYRIAKVLITTIRRNVK